MSEAKTTIVTIVGANGHAITCSTKYPSRTAKLAHRRAHAHTLEQMAIAMRKCDVGRTALTNAKGSFEHLQEELDKLIEEDRTRAFEVEPMNIEIEEIERAGYIATFQAIVDTDSIKNNADLALIMSSPSGTFWSEIEDLSGVHVALSFFRRASVEGLQASGADGAGVADIPQAEATGDEGQSQAESSEAQASV